MAEVNDSVEKLTDNVSKLSRGLSELQTGFSSVGKALPTDGITKLSTTTVELQRQLGLSARELDKIKESITKVGQATKFYNDIELTSLVKQLQTSSTAFGRAAASSEKYLELLVNKFPVGAEAAIRSLNQMSRTIPELSLALEQGTKAQYDFSTAQSVFIQYGPEALATYNQLTSSSNNLTSQELENIKVTKDFQREIVQLSLVLQKDFLPVISSVTGFMKEMHNTVGDGPAKLLVYAVALGTLGKSLVFVKEGLVGLAGLVGLRRLLGGGAAVAAGGAAATATGPAAAPGVLATAGIGLSKLGPLALIGGTIGLLVKEGLERGAKQYANEEIISRDLRRSPAERASIARGGEIQRAGGTTEYLAGQTLSGMGTVQGASAANEAAARNATGINKLLLEREAVQDRLNFKQKEMNVLQQNNLERSQKFKEIQNSTILEFGALRDTTQRISEYFGAQNSQLESQAKILENMNRPLGERAAIHLKEISLLRQQYDVQNTLLQQMEKVSKNSLETEKQRAVVMGIQEQISSKALMARRTWMEQMTALSIGLPQGTYVLPNEIPGVQALGGGYQAFRPAQAGDRFGGTLENMRGMLENAAWSGSSWRTPAEQDVGSIAQDTNEIARKQLEVSEKVLNALLNNSKGSPDSMNQPNPSHSFGDMSGLTNQK